jgi:hypothetical protein
VAVFSSLWRWAAPFALNVSLCGISHAADVSYRLDFLPGLGTSGGGRVTAINNLGQAAGIDSENGIRDVAVVWTDGKARALPNGPDRVNWVTDINDHGAVVGNVSRLDGSTNAVIWQDGQTVYLPLMGRSSGAIAINNAGLVLGQSYDPDDVFVWNGQATTSLSAGALGSIAMDQEGRVLVSDGLDAPRILGQNGETLTLLPSLPSPDGGNVYTQALSINGAGTVAVGIATADRTTKAVMWVGTQLSELPSIATYKGSSFAPSMVVAVNDAGWAVGHSWIEDPDRPSIPSRFDPRSRAVLWKDGEAVDLDGIFNSQLEEGWHLASAVDINNLGQIVGIALNERTMHSRSFLLTPVPEPSTLAFLSLGLGGLAVAVSRRRHRITTITDVQTN